MSNIVDSTSNKLMITSMYIVLFLKRPFVTNIFNLRTVEKYWIYCVLLIFTFDNFTSFLLELQVEFHGEEYGRSKVHRRQH